MIWTDVIELHEFKDEYLSYGYADVRPSVRWRKFSTKEPR